MMYQLYSGIICRLFPLPLPGLLYNLLNDGSFEHRGSLNKKVRNLPDLMLCSIEVVYVVMPNIPACNLWKLLSDQVRQITSLSYPLLGIRQHSVFESQPSWAYSCN